MKRRGRGDVGADGGILSGHIAGRIDTRSGAESSAAVNVAGATNEESVLLGSLCASGRMEITRIVMDNKEFGADRF